jgi:hypothetical protein
LKSKIIFIAGLIFLLLGISMFIWGMHMFTYRGNFTRLMSITGEYSFLFCIPVFIIGLTLLIIGKVKR